MVLLCIWDRFTENESCSECTSKAFQNNCSPFFFLLVITCLHVGMPNICRMCAGNQWYFYCTYQLRSTEPADKMHKLIRRELTQLVLISANVQCHSQSIVFFPRSKSITNESFWEARDFPGRDWLHRCSWVHDHHMQAFLSTAPGFRFGTLWWYRWRPMRIPDRRCGF